MDQGGHGDRGQGDGWHRHRLGVRAAAAAADSRSMASQNGRSANGGRALLNSGFCCRSYHDQPDIAKIISPLDRKSLFLTTKIPTGFGNKTDCSPDPDMIIR